MLNTVIPAGQPSAPVVPRSLPAIRAAGPEGRLRAVLAANAFTSGVTGVAGLIAAGFWADKAGIDNVTVVRLVSAALIVFTLGVAFVAFRATSGLRRGATVISAVDIAWVLGTIAVIATADLTTFGVVVAIVLGVGVADFAALQLWYRSRIR